MRRYTFRPWALLLALSVLLSLGACGRISAATMHLRYTEGKVTVYDGGGKKVALKDNLGLYSGYRVKTRLSSYAWIDLDDVKLAKLDQGSEITVRKKGRDLEINVRSGSLFFNVSEPLADDETMSIRTSTMVVGIRGTCGWVEDHDSLSRMYLLEGKVECSGEDRTVRVRAGEMAELAEDGEFTVNEFTQQDIPDFVLEDLSRDPGLRDDICEASGLDIPDGSGPAAAGRPYDGSDYYNILRGAQAGDVITLTGDGVITPSDDDGLRIRGGGEDDPVILDLNGHTLTMTDYTYFSVFGTVRICDSSGTGSGTLELRTHIHVQDTGRLYLDGGTLSNAGNVVLVGGIDGDSAFTMNGGTISGSDPDGTVHVFSGGSSFTMNGGTINSGADHTAVKIIDGAAFVQNGGTVDGDVQMWESASFIQNGGTFTGTVINSEY